jgi:ABC-type Fe3+ transport system substrate-binding protein
MVDNMARAPKGGDTDQIKAVASGECGIAVTNTYYLARLMRSTNPADKALKSVSSIASEVAMTRKPLVKLINKLIEVMLDPLPE